MTQVEDTSRDMRLDPDSFAQGYFKNAVYRHWDPYGDIPQEDIEADRRKFIEDEPTEAEFEGLRTTLALFGAGEEAVTEDLMPLGMVLEDINKQMFVSSQIYEEAKHTQFFDRYWREVINPVEEELGFDVTRPTDQRFFNDDYVELFDRNEAAMERLLEEDTPETRAKAYCHYHLVVESVLAQTGYYGIQSAFSDQGSDEVAVREFPHMEGLVEGITRIRSDEGRHVGFGMQEVRTLIHEEGVDAEVVQNTLQDLMPLVAGVVRHSSQGEATNPIPVIEYSRDKLSRRVEILTEQDAEIPPVDDLVKIEGDGEAAAD
ncbi:ferritin family protein [Halorientalis regularis]|jgi:ribonucleoside-diphosphate reductase beta chain|uniref:Ribonucleoside-diphosphate reductase beta chain n=1 Tax=Halorientalis regularis TaxID=660518 RepID=A0A1G7TEX9_9EURY|nr:ribonucleoside-diphosphate reductase [Halorientalis regularis]SDG33917.1 ribonucleoside-diphosphate reductase beta chain [Halorientalis regularis]